MALAPGEVARMRRLVALMLVGVLVVGCGDAPRAELSSEPPWGLTSIDMPETEADVVAVMKALPDEIGGLARSGGGPTGVMYGESEIPWMVTTLSTSDSAMQTGILNPDPTPAEYVADNASHGA
jgi:hypothetical protein